MQVAARAWLNSQIQAWQKNVNIATKRANVRDNDGNIAHQLTHSKSPLKEFPDTSFREREREREGERESKTQIKVNTPEAQQKKGNGTVTNEKHVMMQSISFLIYEMNKCSIALTQQNASELTTHLSQTKSTFC